MRFARAARRSECRDRAVATTNGPACRAGAGSSPPGAASGHGRDRRASSVRDERRRRRAVRRACAAYAARRRVYPPRSAAPQDRAPRMVVRIVEKAWSADILENRIAFSVSAYAAGWESLLPLEYAKYKNRLPLAPYHLLFLFGSVNLMSRSCRG